jgi:hypothetical protein
MWIPESVQELKKSACRVYRLNRLCRTTLYYLDFIHRPYVLQPQRFEGWLFPRHQVKPTLLGTVDRASLCRWLTDRDKLMTREEPSLETL